MKAPPKRGDFGSLKSGTRCVSVGPTSFDLFEERGGDVDLFDGDQIAVLIATHLNELVESAAPFLTDVTVGVVQTACERGVGVTSSRRWARRRCVDRRQTSSPRRRTARHRRVLREQRSRHHVVFRNHQEEDRRRHRRTLVQRPCARQGALGVGALPAVINPAVGDAMSGILLVEGIRDG